MDQVDERTFQGNEINFDLVLLNDSDLFVQQKKKFPLICERFCVFRPTKKESS